MLSVQDVQVWFPIRRGILNRVAGYVRAVDGISLEIGRGETLGLVGESGCGKSTLGRAIVGLESVTSGRICYGGVDLATLSGRERRNFHRRCQMIFQDPYSSLNPRMSVLDIVTEGMLHHGIIRHGEREQAALKLLSEVGMDGDCLQRYPHEFSGGQRQRISIARSLGLEPQFLVCDEPVSALDVSVQAQVINLLMDLQERHGFSSLFISHDLNVVRMISQRVAVMYLGRLVELGTIQEVMENPQHPYTQALLSAVPRPGQPLQARMVLQGEQPSAAMPPTGCAFHPRCPYATEVCSRIMPELKESHKGHLCRCLRLFPNHLALKGSH